MRTMEEKHNEALINTERYQRGQITPQITKTSAKRIIQEQKFKKLQKYLKGDI